MRATLWFVIGFVLSSSAGCNPSRQELQQSHEAPGGEYRIFYQDPPWTMAETEGAYLRLEVESNSVRFGGVDASVVPPKFLFEASVDTGSAADRARRDERDARTEGDEIIRPVGDVMTAAGVTGSDVVTSRLTSDGSRFRRFVYLDRSSGVVRLYFEANTDLRDAEVDAMIADVEVDIE